MKIFMVGGAVRDRLLGITPKDIDYVVVGSTPDEMISLGYSQVGADFPVFLHPTTKEEYALARTERKVGPGYHGFVTDFNPNTTIEEDLMRRDLTINSMAIDMETDELIDPYAGQADLKLGILRHTSDAFRDDPVRILRLARFAARYGFTVDWSTRCFAQYMVEKGALDELTPERVWKEISRGIMEPNPTRLFLVLGEVDASTTPHIRPFCGCITHNYDIIYAKLSHPSATALPVRMALMYNSHMLDANGKVSQDLCMPIEVARVVAAAKHMSKLALYPYLTPDMRYLVLGNIGAIGSLRNTEVFQQFIQVASIEVDIIEHDTPDQKLTIDFRRGLELVKQHQRDISNMDVRNVIACSSELPVSSIKTATLALLTTSGLVETT